jgi:hypothetical protein
MLARQKQWQWSHEGRDGDKQLSLFTLVSRDVLAREGEGGFFSRSLSQKQEKRRYVGL